ncbi:MAG: hypothetical protein QNK23_08620 [Crocinitomicaceae bacterium]|nr:hypothetical protein [Crocinitomicaceae bacterium]
MSKTSNRTSEPVSTPLASFQCLKYLGIVSVVIILYVVIMFYNQYGDDIFPNSLTVGQHIRLSLYCIGSEISDLIVPLLFFSGALLYRSVRLKGINPITAFKRDLLVIAPLGIALWIYGAYYESSVKTKFYGMLFEVQELELGEKLVQNPTTYELMKAPNLNGLRENIDTLNIQIKDAEDKLMGQLNSRSPMVSYIEELQNQQRRYQDEIKFIHFTPLCVLLLLLLGMILGYLIPLHIAALTATLIVIGYTWHYSMSFLEVSFDVDDSNRSSLLLSKIGVLLIVNATLLIVASKVYKRSKKEDL